MTTTKSILKEQSEMMLMMKSDIREMKLYMEAFMKALTTEGASFPVVIVKDETKRKGEPKSSISEETEGLIARDVQNGMSEREIAKKYGMSKSSVHRHKRRQPTVYDTIPFTDDFNEKYIRLSQVAQVAGKRSCEIEAACDILGYKVYSVRERCGSLSKAIEKGCKFPLLTSDFWKRVEGVKERKPISRREVIFTNNR